MSLEQASEMLVDRSLDWNVADSVYDPRELPLTVLGQFPEAARQVKEDRVVHLTVNRLTPQMVEVPVEQVLEKTLRSVQFKLQGKGFKIGELIYKPGVYDNQVLELRKGGTVEVLEAGAMLPKGAVVDLVVTDGYGNTRIVMPDFKGRSYAEAEFLLQANNLVEGRISFGPEATAEDSISFVVLRQQPESGEDVYIKEGSTVDLWFGSMDDYLESENQGLESDSSATIRPLPEEIQEVEQ
jgi:beta-lactam-binding protein with PASTA domain